MKLALIALIAFAGAASAAPFDLGTQRNLPVGAAPSGVVIEDFNGDGNLDFAVTQRDVDSLTVWLGLGFGKIGAPTRYPTGDFPVAIAAGDLNEDGRLDLVIANQAANTITLYRGAVFGTFSNRVDYAVGSQPTSVAIANLDGDTHADVAVCNFLSNSVSVLKGGFKTGLNGSGFVVPTGTGPRGLAIADFNRDGLNDLITANVTADSVSVIPNTVNGFAPRYDLDMFGDPSAVAVGDVNNDGWPDAVVARTAPGYVTFLKNTNGILTNELTYGAEANPDCVVIADIHGDTSPDIVVGHSTSGLVTVLTGGGDGQFTLPQSVMAGGSGVLALATGDLDNDGIKDIVAPSLAPALVSVLYADRHYDAGPFGGVGFYVIGQGGAGLATGDFNGDTFIDLAVTARSSGYAKTFWNDGNGVFPEETERYIFGQWGANALDAADFNGDGLTDLAMTTFLTGPSDTNRVRVFLNQGKGAFEPYTDYDIGVPGRIGMQIGDLTNDGKLDLVTAHQGTTEVRILAGNGLGDFSLGPLLTTLAGPTTVDLADVNGGGLDVFVGGPGFVSVFIANGSGGFLPRVDYNVSAPVLSLVHADLDEDGKMDWVCVIATGYLVYARGDGLGGFITTSAIPIPNATAVAAGDFNGDGDVDLLVGRNATYANILYGSGDGTFPSPVPVYAGNAPVLIASAPLDKNPTPDLLFVGANTTASPRLTKVRTRTTLAVTPNPSAIGQSITYKATVTKALPDSSNPVGTVYFFDGTTYLGSAAVTGGVATLVQPGNYPWERKISASFKTDVNGTFQGSSSRSVDHMTYIPNVGVEPGPVVSALALAPLRNPVRAGEALRVRLSLASASAARLTLLDVRGRVLAARDVLEGGVVELPSPTKLAAGVYLVRLEQDGLRATTRAVVL